jgi:hypothetical protein
MIIEKDSEGSGRSLIEVISQHFPKETEENHENCSEDNLRSGQDSSLIPPVNPYVYVCSDID